MSFFLKIGIREEGRSDSEAVILSEAEGEGRREMGEVTAKLSSRAQRRNCGEVVLYKKKVP
jgi:hypothetical protein